MRKFTNDIMENHAKGISGYIGPLEIPDPTPMELPLDFMRPKPLHEEIAQLVHNSRVQAELEAQGIETFEEADDFEIEEDEKIQSPWEEPYDTGKVWTRDMEIRAGIVSQPDYAKAKELRDKCESVIKAYESKKAGQDDKPTGDIRQEKAQ